MAPLTEGPDVSYHVWSKLSIDVAFGVLIYVMLILASIRVINVPIIANRSVSDQKGHLWPLFTTCDSLASLVQEFPQNLIRSHLSH